MGKEKNETVLEAEAKAEAIRIVAKAEADAIRMKGEAEAAVMEQKAKIMKQYGISGQPMDVAEPASEKADPSVKKIHTLIRFTLDEIQKGLFDAGCRNIDVEMADKKAEVILAQADCNEREILFYDRIKMTLAAMLSRVEGPPFPLDVFPFHDIAIETAYGILMNLLDILRKVFPLAFSNIKKAGGEDQ